MVDKMLRSPFLVLLCLHIHISLNIAQEQTSFKVFTTNSGLNYAGQVALDILNAQIPTLQIPDIDDGDIKATNFKITQYTSPKSQISLQAPSTVSWTLTGVAITITAHVEACKKILGHNFCGDIDVEMGATGTNIQALAIFGRAPTDMTRPTILQAQCHTTIGDLDVHTEGGALGWIINLFKSIIASEVKPKIEQTLSDEVSKLLLTNVNQILATIPVVEIFDNKYTLDYGLAADPAITAEYIELDMKGQITCPTAPSVIPPYPFTPLVFQIQEQLRMIYVLISDKIINDLMYFSHTLNDLSYLITSENTPIMAPILQLQDCPTAFCLGCFAADLAAQYPNVTAAQISLRTTIPPILTISPGSADLDANLTMDLFLPTPNANVSALLATFVARTNLIIKVADQKIVGLVNITSDLKMDAIQSLLPEDISKTLENLLGMALKPVIEKELNQAFGAGFPIPNIGSVALTNPLIKLLDRTVQLESDVKYHG